MIAPLTPEEERDLRAEHDEPHLTVGHAYCAPCRLLATIDAGRAYSLIPTEELARLRAALAFIADWAHDCSPSNAATPWDRQHPDEIDPSAYGFDDIEERCRAALEAKGPRT